MRTERQEIVSEVLAGVKELFEERCLPQLVDAPTLARAFNVDAHTIYRNAAKLGGIKIGASLRFDPAVAIERARLESELPLRRPQRTRGPVETDWLPPIS